MKASSKELLEKISSITYTQSTPYRFNSQILNVSKKYKEGRLTAYNYIGELCFYFLQEEKNIPERFIEQIKEQIQKYSSLNDGDYKKGLFDVLNDVLDEIDSR